MAKFDLKKAILENKATFFGSLTEGQFSWMTQDTGQQIGSQDENKIPVYMFDDKGKYYYENDYDGYGEFGGKDYYDLVAEMNGYTADDAEKFGGTFGELRGIGIKLAFGELEPKNGGPVLFPALVTKPDKFNYKSHNFAVEAETDPNQSWYEPEEDEEDNSFDLDDDEEYGYNDDEEELDENKEIKPTTKMKKSDLKAKIKEMIVAEIALDIDNMEDAPESEVDFLAELESMLNEAEGLTPLQDYVYQYEIEISGEDEAQEFLDDIRKLNTPQDVYDYYAYDRDWSGSMDDDLENIFRQVKRKFKNLNEASEFDTNKPARIAEFLKALDLLVYDEYHSELYDSDEVKQAYDLLVKAAKKLGNLNEADETEKDTAEAEDVTVDDTETIDTETTTEVNPDVKAVQDALTQAQAAAQKLGDAKLTDQIGNTITFFTRAHVVEKGAVAEVEEMEEVKKKDLNESMFPMLKKILK
jgi:cytochrome c556